MWETGRARGVLKGSEFRKGRKKCQGWGVFERSLFICKVFSPKWGPGAGWRREKEAGVSLGLYLLQLRWITKLLPWANHSKRLTSSTTEPVIPFEEIGNWFLLEEREIIQQIGALVESHLLSGENCELCCFFYVLLLCFFSPSIKWQPSPLRVSCEDAAWSDRRSGCLPGMHECPEFLRWHGADHLHVEGGGGGWREFPWVTQTQMNL